MKSILDWMGWTTNTTSHLEKLVSATGGAVGIYIVFLMSKDLLGLYGAALMVASMGASAVLLFAVPHGALSQPWAVLGGHTVSAIVGVSVGLLIDNPIIGGSLAVGLAILAMHYTRCIHPPGGATALSFIIGGPQVHALGYHYVIEPVLVNAVIIVTAAIVVNFGFEWRRYPAAWRQRVVDVPGIESSQVVLSRDDLEYALKAMDLTLDVSEHDLERLIALANRHATDFHVDLEQLNVGRYYSNGRYGEDWEVRYIVDEVHGGEREDDILSYRIVAGGNRNRRGTAKRSEFAKWASYEVFLNENSWQRVTPVDNS